MVLLLSISSQRSSIGYKCIFFNTSEVEPMAYYTYINIFNIYLDLRSYHFIFHWAKTCLTQATATLEVIDFIVASSSLKPVCTQCSKVFRVKENRSRRRREQATGAVVAHTCDEFLQRWRKTFTSVWNSCLEQGLVIGIGQTFLTFEDLAIPIKHMYNVFIIHVYIYI